MIVLRAMRPAQSSWSLQERARLDFYRWLVVRGTLTDGESERQMLTEGKYCHRFPTYLKTWTQATADAHEAGR